MQSPVLLNPRNADFASGKSQNLRGTSKTLLLALWSVPTVLAVVTIVGIYLTVHFYSIANKLASFGTQVEGTITQIKLIDSDTRHYFYEFPVGTEIIEGIYRAKSGTILALGDNSERTKQGDTVPVIYLASDPTISSLTQMQSKPYGLAIFTLTIAIVSAVFFAVGRLTLSGHNRNKNAQRLRATVEKIKSIINASGNLDYTLITYTFRSPNSHQQLTRDHKFYGPLPTPAPEQGHEVWVAYFNDEENWLL